ncbi:MAG: SEC-C metal-binding domain-containing protein [Lachnospiraceae bacterium]|nr:SEC-C metal-binding domain-containing protein [Lachnospiraceae bacterium]
MRLTAKDISARLKKMYVRDLRGCFEIMVNVIRSNSDFLTAKSVIDGKDPDSLVDVVNDVLEKEHMQVDFDVRDILKGDSKETFDKIMEIDSAVKLTGSNKRIQKMRKAEIVEIMSQVLANPVLFEGMCLCIPGNIEEAEEVMSIFRCEENYLELKQDEVYRKRKEFVMMLRAYTLSAVNLYGAIRVPELWKLIWDYEKSWHSREAFLRKDGPYPHTLAYNPRYFTDMVLHHFCGNSVPEVFMTLDGVIANKCFRDEFIEGQKKMFQIADDMMKGRNGLQLSDHQQLENDFFEMYLNESDESYRYLLDEANEKPRYVPKKEEFLKYTDEYYFQETAEDRKLKTYLRSRYRKQIRNYARKCDMTPKEVMSYLWGDIKYAISDHNEYWDEIEPSESIASVFGLLKDYNIILDRKDELNEFISFLLPVYNNTRQWFNNGHTPMEISSSKTVDKPFHPTIVPMSSHAAELLRQGQEEIEKMGAFVDLDSNADDINTFSFADGIAGPMKKQTKKIYPNDPCPCGSGKKYKNCCGRKK